MRISGRVHLNISGPQRFHNHWQGSCHRLMVGGTWDQTNNETLLYLALIARKFRLMQAISMTKGDQCTSAISVRTRNFSGTRTIVASPNQASVVVQHLYDLSREMHWKDFRSESKSTSVVQGVYFLDQPLMLFSILSTVAALVLRWSINLFVSISSIRGDRFEPRRTSTAADYHR